MFLLNNPSATTTNRCEKLLHLHKYKSHRVNYDRVRGSNSTAINHWIAVADIGLLRTHSC